MNLNQFCTEENKRPGAKRSAWNIPQEHSSAIERYLLELGRKRTLDNKLSGSDQGFMIQSYGKNNDKFYLESEYTAQENSEMIRAIAKAAAESEKY
jgi:hypothetical protein